MTGQDGAEAGAGEGHYAGVGEIGSDLVRVVKGDPDEAELAALVAGIVAARTAAAHEESDDGARTSLWADRAHQLGRAPAPGRGAWRWSALPR